MDKAALALFFSVLALIASVGTLVLHSIRIGQLEDRVEPARAMCAAPCTVFLPDGTQEDSWYFDYTHVGITPVVKVIVP